MSKYRVQYDVVRIFPFGLVSQCAHPSDRLGFDKLSDAESARAQLDAAYRAIGALGPGALLIVPVLVADDALLELELEEGPLALPDLN